MDIGDVDIAVKKTCGDVISRPLRGSGWNAFWLGLVFTLLAVMCYDRYVADTWQQEMIDGYNFNQRETARIEAVKALDEERILAVIDSNKARAVELETAWVELKMQYEQKSEQLMADYQTAMDEQLRIAEEAQFNREEVILAAERFGTFAIAEGERATAAEKSLAEMVTLAKGLKEEVKRLTYQFENQVQLVSDQTEAISNKQAEIDYLWSTVHEARGVVYRLNDKITNLEWDLEDAQAVINLLSSHLWLYENVDDVLSTPTPPDAEGVPTIIVPCDDDDGLGELGPDSWLGSTIDVMDEVAGRYHQRKRTSRFFNQGKKVA
jgi:hypothetical protein